MNRCSVLSSVIGVIALAAILATWPFDAQTQPQSLYSNIESRHVDVWSDGTRLSGDLFYPKDLKAEDKLPAIILCHGWGGVRSHLNSDYAPHFARAGFVVLTFDYRGWGDSDSRLVIKGEMPKPDANGEVTVRAQAIRELVDPFDQTEDIINCIDFIAGGPGVDPNRIGLWGTSYGGGHVVYVAAHDKRVRCIVSQVSSMDSRGISRYAGGLELHREKATQRARGEIDPIPQGVDRIPGLRGTPFISRMENYRPVDFADQLDIPVLIIDAEKEELFDITLNGQLVYERVKDLAPAKYELFPGTHYEIYGKGREEAIRMAIEWFIEHLKEGNDNAESSTPDLNRSTRTESLFEMMVSLRPEGWKTLDEVKQFTPENLYELIDGRAELYLAYDMVKMTFTSFVNAADAEKFIELSIYDMGTPTNAFGVFSVERSKEVTPLALGRASYRMDAHYFIWKGQYYIRIITSDASDELETIGMDLAVKVTNFLPDAGESVWGLSALSQLDVEPDSVKYFKVDAMGLDFMRNTYTARYRKDESLITVFLSQEESAESAATTVGRYTEYAQRYGDTVERLTFENMKLTACDMKGSYDVVFSKGRLVAGVYSAEDKILAVRTAAELSRRLSDE